MTGPRQSERSRMRRRVRTFATTIANELRENKSYDGRAWNGVPADCRAAHDEALEFAARLLEQRGRG